MPLTQTVAQSLRPSPQFLAPGAVDLGPPIGKTWYDSLQTSVSKRFSHGLSMQASFVWAKGLVNGTGAEAGNITTLQGIPIYNDIYNYGINKQLNQLVRPDVAVVVYNDHGLNFFLDKMPTFAIGAAAEYSNADEGWGLPVVRPFPGNPDLSWHLIESLVADEFDITSCQELSVDHGFAEHPADFVGSGEKSNIFGSKIGRETRHEDGRTHYLCIARRMVGQRITGWRHIGRIEFKRLCTGKEFNKGRLRRRSRYRHKQKERGEQTCLHGGLP